LQPIEVTKIEANATIVLNNLFFDFNKAVLKEESFSELNRMIDLMNKTSSMKVEITGHTDSDGPAAYNLKLSERRARAVASYLTNKGINKSRIKVKFYGEEKPSHTNDTHEGKSKNRRVEFKILNL